MSRFGLAVVDAKGSLPGLGTQSAQVLEGD